METFKPYIAKIVERYRTGNGNYFCREEGKNKGEHHLNWPIFVPKEIGDKVGKLPFYGIVILDRNDVFFNDKHRLTCRIISEDFSEIQKICNVENDLDLEIEKEIADGLKQLGQDLE